MSPLLIRLAGEPGQTLPFEIEVFGLGSGRIRLAANTLRQMPTGHVSFGGQREENLGPERYQAQDWIEFERTSYRILRNETTHVEGMVSIPRNSGEGTYLAAVMVEEDPEASRIASIAVKVRYAVIFTIEVGTAPRRPASSFGALNIVEADHQTMIESTFTNQSAFIITLQSDIQVRDGSQRLAARTSLRTESAWQRGDQASRVHPGATVKVYGPIEHGLASGEYTMLARNKVNQRLQSAHRAHRTHVSSIPTPAFTQMPVLEHDSVIVEPNPSGTSLTPVLLVNPGPASIRIRFPDGGRRLEDGVSSFKFVPDGIQLRPFARRRIMLRQEHVKDREYTGSEFTITAISSRGEEAKHTLRALPVTP